VNHRRRLIEIRSLELSRFSGKRAWDEGQIELLQRLVIKRKLPAQFGHR
jgi:hypothetical protein